METTPETVASQAAARVRLKEIEMILDSRHDAYHVTIKPLQDEAKALNALLSRRYWITDQWVASWDQAYERLDVMKAEHVEAGFLAHIHELNANELHLYAEVMALFEIWRRGELECLPPTGTWLKAKLVLLATKGHDWVHKNILCEEI